MGKDSHKGTEEHQEGGDCENAKVRLVELQSNSKDKLG